MKIIESAIAGAELPPEAAERLNELGFAVLPGLETPGGVARLSAAYDDAVEAADPSEVSVRASTRVSDFVNRGPEFDGIYVYPPILAACRHVIGDSFKLSTMLARTLEPGAPAQSLHVDVKHRADGWPLLGFIVMVDAFHADNGATRFVPGTHRLSYDPTEVVEGLTEARPDEVFACGPAGSILVFNGSAWHGYGANRSAGRRRSIQGAFIPREARSATNHAARIRPETWHRISDLAKYLLDIESVASQALRSYRDE